ncbi:MAG: HAMP domain-containing histidine kinase [Ruminococcaceae bacterium]|nr:HAMP domain-containing histidine kinase [Oscillospiraceae bacterium]
MARFRGIKRRWLTNNLSLIALFLLIAAVVFVAMVHNFFYSNLSSLLVTRANASASMFQTYINKSENEFFDGAKRYTADFVDKDKMEFEVIGLSGYVISSSSSSILTGFRPGTPDVAEALATQKTVPYTGVDSLTGERVMSVSAPVFLASGELIGTIRYVTGLSVVTRGITELTLVAIGVIAIIFFFVIFSNRYFIRSIVNPIREINETTKRIAAGEYGITIEKTFNDEIGELADSINFMSSETQRSIMIKNDFISSVSHELRTPLTAINGWTETLLHSEGLDKISQRGLSVILRESNHLREMVEELLDFSRIESGRLVINRTHIDLKAELEDTIIMFEQRLAQDKLHVVYTDNCDDEVILLGDRSRLRQVFVNIIDNARKYSPPDATIDISIEERGEMVAVIIADHGSGISAVDLPHVKQKFYKGNANKPGSGIGLAVSDEIIQMHKGELLIESTEGEGTTVTILLPLNEEK